MSQKNHQKVVLITGAAKRIGACIADHFHQNGFRIIVHYRHSKKAAETLVKKCNQRRKNSAVALYADLDAFSDYKKLIHDSIQVWKRLDILINNASTFFQTPIGDVNEAEWKLLINSNLKAPFFLSQYAASFLKKQNGCIINIVDIHAKTPMKNYPIYSAAKAGLFMLTQSLALELAPHIRVNAIAPGHVIWPINQKAFSKSEKKAIESSILLKKNVRPDDIAAGALFLATQPAITGQMIAVDGGRTPK